MRSESYDNSSSTPFVWALAFAAFSGAAALSHELIWTRRLVDLLGASTESTARVFACFFLGLSLGSACSVMWASRSVARPWRVVAALEFSIALFCLPALTLPAWTSWIWPWLGPEQLVGWMGSAIKLCLSVLVVLPPAFLMGMTLPFIARGALGGSQTLGVHGTWLYAVNTLGGVLGILFLTSVTLPRLGAGGSMIAAISLNLLVAVFCLILDRRGSPPSPRSTPTIAATAPVASAIPRAAYVLSFFSGACILGIEMLILHLFAQVAPTALHGPAAILGAVITLLGLSAALAPFIAKRLADATDALVPILALAGVLTAITPLLFMRITNHLISIPPSSTVPLFIGKIFLYVLCSAGPSVLLAGLVLPLVFSWVASDADPYGRRWGSILALNGLGGLFGTLFAQHFVMYAFAMHVGLGVIGLLYGLLAVGLVLVTEKRNAFLGSFWRYSGIRLLIIAIGWGWLTKLRLIHPSPNKHVHYRILSLRAGPEGVVAVTDSEAMGKGIVMFNQYVLGTTKSLLDEQRQAHLPLLLHPEPRSVAMIGLATGITAGSALYHDSVEELTVIELSGLVDRACRGYFGSYNNGLYGDKRAEIVVEDGRTFIASCRNRYDVIIGDLFLPWRAGVGRLYTLEHFRAVRDALKAGEYFVRCFRCTKSDPNNTSASKPRCSTSFPPFIYSASTLRIRLQCWPWLRLWMGTWIGPGSSSVVLHCSRTRR